MTVQTEKSWLTVGVPEGTDGLIEIFEPSAALRMAVVERAKIRTIDEADWQEPGVYVLLYRHRKPDAWEGYVGKATALRSRVLYHANDKDRGSWYRVLLVRRDTTHGFNSAQIAWLESRLHRKLTSSVEASLRNKQEPADENLPTDEHWLENVAPAVLRVLQMLGHNPAAAGDDDGGSTDTSRTRRTFAVSIADLVSANLLPKGEEVVSTNSRWPASGYVTKDGKITYEGEIYDSPSSAAQAAKKGGAVNRWEFWSVKRAAGKVSLAELRAEFRSSRTDIQPKSSRGVRPRLGHQFGDERTGPRALPAPAGESRIGASISLSGVGSPPTGSGPVLEVSAEETCRAVSRRPVAVTPLQDPAAGGVRRRRRPRLVRLRRVDSPRRGAERS